MSKISDLTYILFGIVLLCPIARSQEVTARSFDLAGTVGWTNLSGADNKTHVAFGGDGGFNLTKNLQAFGEFLYNPLGSLSESTSVGVVTADEKATSFGGGVRYHFGRWAHIAPFVVVSGGFYRLSASSGGVSIDQNGGYFSAGGGADLFVTRRFGIRPEARLQRIQLGNLLGVSGTGGSGDSAVVTVGLFYQLGGK